MAAELPSGTVTFLFSDVEASTRLAHRLGDEEYQQVIERHRGDLRRAFASHSGHEVGTEGDSFFIAFERAEDALAAAIDGQLALASGHDAVRVRMGLHTGEAAVADGDYFGLSVHQAARIASAAHGGQVLVSAATAGLADTALPEGSTLEDLGEHRLKDLERPLRLLQLCHPRLDRDFPPPRSLELVRHNLPVQTSTFVGREQELAEVARMLASARMVSLLGPGGTGKTRLAYQAAAEAVSDFPDGIWVTELAPVTEETSIPLAALRSVGLREEAGRSPTDTLVDHLRDRQALMILDNCEQVVAGAASLAQALLSKCPRLRVLVTSREPLRIPGEGAYHVPGLGMPAAIVPAELDVLAETDAVRLFVTRAGEVRPGFALRPDNAADIAMICRGLDGLPLAIELAASRARSLSASQIRERLGRTLDLLSRGTRGVDARQATLRGAIEWSHRLLAEGEQVLFRRLAVFAGGWQLEAAEGVCSGEGLEVDGVLDTLDSLVDKSLVAVDEDEKGQTRYRLLGTIRAYATECLEAAGESDPVADRHSAWYAALVAAASESPLGSTQQAGWFDRLEADHANHLAALGHLIRHADPEAVELAGRMGPFWGGRAHWLVGREQLGAALLVASGPSSARARVLGGLGIIAHSLGDFPEARARFQEALDIARDLGDRQAQGRHLGGLGNLANALGNYPEARTHFEEALDIAREIDDRWGEGAWLGSLGFVAAALGHYPEARTRFHEALDIAREIGDRRAEGTWLGNLGNVAHALGDNREARARLEEALDIARDLGDRPSEGRLLGNLGNVAHALSDFPEARARYQEALDIAREIGNRPSEGACLGNLGNVAHALSDFPEARARYQEALDIARDLGDRRAEGYWLGNLGNVALSLGDYAEVRVRYHGALDIAREIGDRLSEGRHIGGLGSVAHALGDYPEARARFQAALDIAREIGNRPSEGICLGSLGSVAHTLGDFPEARARYQEALDIAREIGDRPSEGFWLCNLGAVATALGDWSEARGRCNEALGIAQDLKSPALSVNVIDAVAVLLATAGQYEEAVELVEWADETRRRIGSVREKAEQDSADQLMSDARDHLSGDALEQARKQGAARTATEMLDFARASLADSSRDAATAVPHPGEAS
ncbi:MAG: tetratricopeptide repeat protein [Candidatus Dormibacteria bacterium]